MLDIAFKAFLTNQLNMEFMWGKTFHKQGEKLSFSLRVGPWEGIVSTTSVNLKKAGMASRIIILL